MNFENRYGFVARIVHRIAFASPSAQIALCDLEERMFRRELETVAMAPPILITALPRAGTTILLELLAATPSCAAHTYRDMPFVMCPALWHRIGHRLYRAEAPRERAHGDGIKISIDSPEAFEEVIWKTFWRKRYRGSVIGPWDRCDEADFVAFLTQHMRKIVALRARGKPTARRYLSKNNLNIARIPAIWGAFPTALLVVPFRDPLQQAASLLRQHERFTELHARDAFSRRYMAAIGHHDFGANLKPVNFGAWVGRYQDRDPHQLQFWLEYWLATYRHVLQHRDRERLILVGFEALVSVADIGPLAERLQLEDPAALQAQRGTLRPAPRHEIAMSSVSESTAKAARDLHEELGQLSIL